MVTEGESQANASGTSQHARDISEGQAWTALLGLDGFDPFTNDGFTDELPFADSSMADAFHLATMDFPIPTAPPTSHQVLHPAADVSTGQTLAGTRQWIPPTSTSELDGSILQPWPPPLPSIGPEVSPVRISDAVLSDLRSSLGEEDRQRLTTSALRLFLGTYFNVFNVHLPLLHAPSFDPDHQLRGLLLAIAAIGALYRLEHRSANLLYWAADGAAPVGASRSQMESSYQGTSSPSPGTNTSGKWQCLAYFQTRLLLQYFGILGGAPELAERSLGMIAELSLTVGESHTP